MGKNTDFDFGFNVRDPSNADPWGQNTEPDRRHRQAKEDDHTSSSSFRPVPDSGSVSEDWLVNTTCATVLKMVHNITETVRKGNRTMAINLQNFYNEKKARSGANGFKRNPFLKAEHVPARNGLAFTVISLREANGGFSDLLMDVKTKGGDYTVGLKSDSVLLGQLCQQFGMKDNKWPGKKGTFVLAKGKYINLQPAK